MTVNAKFHCAIEVADPVSDLAFDPKKSRELVADTHALAEKLVGISETRSAVWIA